MKLAMAQISSVPGAVDRNLAKHQHCISLAAHQGVDWITFPELSLTGYEPKLAQSLATDPTDRRLDAIQTLSDRHRITIALGLPIDHRPKPSIGLVILQPQQPRQTYAKQYLHPDEDPYFTPGQKMCWIYRDAHCIAPAICYESLQPSHVQQAAAGGASMYWASVAKSAQGVAKAMAHYAAIAQRHRLTVLMTNSLGPCDDFEAVGQSAVWNAAGRLVGQLDDQREGLLIYDTEADQTRAMSV